MNKNLILTLVIALVVAAGAFYAGTLYQQNQRRTALGGRFSGGQFGGGINGTGANRTGTGFRPVNGQILSVENDTMTVKMNDGTSRIVILSKSTSINKAEKASESDLKTGETVAVFGQENPDGSVMAQNIQLNPMMKVLSPTGTK
jgi:hypothetical protein